MPRDDIRLYSARPTVRVAGLAMPVVDAAIHAMVMRERVGGLSSLELGLVDWTSAPDGRAGFAAVGDSPLTLGAPIEVYAGDATGPQQIFAGRITALEGEMRRSGPPLFTVLAEDGLFPARRIRRRRSFEAASPADLIRRVAEDHGLEADIDGLDRPVADWAQINETDLAFLRRVLARVDGDMQVVGGRLQAGPRAARRRSDLTLNWPSELLAVRVTADLADQVAQTTVAGFDPDAGRAVSATAADGTFGPGGGRRAAAILAGAFEAWEERLGTEAPMTEAEAAARARAANGARARRFVRADGTAQGDPALRVGSWLTLTGLNPMFVNAYAVTEATHRFDAADGYLTDFVAECAFLGEAS
jgi:uncharacterized protein